MSKQNEYAPVVAQIDVQADGTMRWHSDGAPIPSCTGCGSPVYERWRAPEAVWKRNKGRAKVLCWSCFMISMDGTTLGPDEGDPA